MNPFLFDLISNLALLAIVLVACHLYNRVAPGAALNGGCIFIALASAALLLDTALTFLVFAHTRRYDVFSATAAFVERAGAYVIVSLIALAYVRYVRYVRTHARANVSGSRRPQRVQIRVHDTLVIRTSAYSESQLPM